MAPCSMPLLSMPYTLSWRKWGEPPRPRPVHGARAPAAAGITVTADAGVTERACLLYPPEARDTLHLRSALRSAPPATVIMGWRPAGHGSKRRNILTRCAPWPKVIRLPEPHPREELDRPTMPAGVTDEAWTMEAAELSRSTRFSRTARPVSDQRHFVVHVYTLSRDIYGPAHAVKGLSNGPTRFGTDAVIYPASW